MVSVGRLVQLVTARRKFALASETKLGECIPTAIRQRENQGLSHLEQLEPRTRP